uniref:GYF domain-containing protein n=1 Tax=Panagrellus redivivus TaxID=6233 RepID=A0A7E4VVC2_PANRE
MGEFENNEIEDLPRWWYMGADRLIHGPFSSADMHKWVQSGYFNDSLMVKTDRDAKFYTLYDYSVVCNGSPFLANAYSYNAAAYSAAPESRSSSVSVHHHQQHQQHPPQHPQMNVNLQSPPQLQHIFQAHSGNGGPMPMPMYGNPNNGQPNIVPQPLPAQLILPPGLEMYQGGVPQGNYFDPTRATNEMLLRENPSSSTISDSPDCEPVIEDRPRAYNKNCGTDDAPWNIVPKKVNASTDTTGFAPFEDNSVGSQTGPQYIRRNDVCKLLKDLTGMSFQTR